MSSSRRTLRAEGLSLAFCSLVMAPAPAQVTLRVSVDAGGQQVRQGGVSPSISADGSCVIFRSASPDLVPGDTNGTIDVFVRNRILSTTTRVNVSSSGEQASGGDEFDWVVALSADGRYAAFSSSARNLVAGDTNGERDVFVHDLVTGATSRVSVAGGGSQANGGSALGSISPDGRYVAFTSDAADLVLSDTNGFSDVFVHDRREGWTRRVSVASDGAQGNEWSSGGSISAAGRFVAFQTRATNLVPNDVGASIEALVHDLRAGTTTRGGAPVGGGQPGASCLDPKLSADGRFVVFHSFAPALAPGDTGVDFDVFVHDRLTLETTLASVSSDGVEGNGESGHFGTSISADGRFVSFNSEASNLVVGDTNAAWDLFVHDRLTGITERINVSTFDRQNSAAAGSSSLSADGRLVSFMSIADDLVAGDTNEASDVFVRDRNAAGFASSCEPGAEGVTTCPCANPPSGPGRGCENSASTGGAQLVARGVAYLSTDTLEFRADGETPHARSIVLQARDVDPAGAVYGQGVRCVDAPLTRLFVKTAVGGTIVAPDPSAGDPSVSARSAALGDPIFPGARRRYMVVYRDPTVLGGCPPTSTFNATQTAEIVWSP